MTLLYSPDRKRRIDYHPDHGEKLEGMGWSQTKEKTSKPKTKKPSDEKQ